jgi:RND family efflux transporter MFP subunit
MALVSSVLRAPFDGVLANCTAETGSLVQSGGRLGELIDISRLLLDADVLESEIRHVGRGDSAMIEVPAIGGGSFAGRVRHINPVHETATRSALVTIAMSPRNLSRPGVEDDARPGMYAIARIIVERLPGRVLVPREAVLSRSNRNMVFLVRDGRSHWTYVDLGEQTASDIAIVRGVAPGDTVIVDGHFALGHAARVRIEPEGGLE